MRKFAIGDRVRKHSGSWWEGRVVGAYDTTQTPLGYNVQLDMVPNGPVQIYPEAALELAPEPPPFKPCIHENPLGGVSEMLLEDCATITGQVMTVRPLYRMSDRQIVGFQWDIPYGGDHG